MVAAELELSQSCGKSSSLNIAVSSHCYFVQAPLSSFILLAPTKFVEPRTAVVLARNIFQFIDFGVKATSTAREMNDSATAALKDNIQLEYLSTYISVAA